MRIESVSFAYGSNPILKDVSLTVPSGAFVGLLGPSGCGKSTLLKLLGGYLSPSSGRIILENEAITSLPPQKRNIGMVFQSYALFPHLTVWENVAFGLDIRRATKERTRQKVEAVLDCVRISQEERNRYPSQLSGGQQQRVALARALVIEPRLLLLDEPLANLDRHLRDHLRTELLRVQQQIGTTTILVTHDREEAMATSQLIGVMNAGRLIQFGPPRELYDRPRTSFVARFLGDVNLIPGSALGLSEGLYLIRPEEIKIGGDLSGTLIRVTFAGSDHLIVLRWKDQDLMIRTRQRPDCEPGQSLSFSLKQGELWRIPDQDEP